MVTNSFGKRNFMKAQACTQECALLFFLLTFAKGGDWGKDFFLHFSLVPNVFP
jgi:hypothetical protein